MSEIRRQRVGTPITHSHGSDGQTTESSAGLARSPCAPRVVPGVAIGGPRPVFDRERGGCDAAKAVFKGAFRGHPSHRTRGP